MPTPRGRRAAVITKNARGGDAPPPKTEPCCCDPLAMVWIDARTECCFIENKIDMKRRLQVRADANASLKRPGGPETNADGSGGSQLDEGTLKDQGKIYRTDLYTIHWRAEGQCQPLRAQLQVGGEVDYVANCIPNSGEVTLSRTYMLEPPNYAASVPGSVTATLTVEDCAHKTAKCENTVQRP